ncbi:MAG TPA: molecular chaperone TorD family protein [Burkholderiales bacterium]|jgi:TorA maturation chaperone TorD|nr:molecular chaperone TorD family protein [Burkholderiales bacterium]
MSTLALPDNEALAAEDAARADLYALLAALWASAPAPSLLQAVAAADDIGAAAEGDPPLAREWRRLQAACAVTDPEAVRAEYRDLFISVGEPPVVLNASWYLTGFLNEVPLAELRDDLARLGFSRLQSAVETEDHIAALLEAMRLLIVTRQDDPAGGFETQKAFFFRHLKPWYTKLAARVEQTEGANFYRNVVALTRVFLDTESAQFENY